VSENYFPLEKHCSWKIIFVESVCIYFFPPIYLWVFEETNNPKWVFEETNNPKSLSLFLSLFLFSFKNFVSIFSTNSDEITLIY